MIASDACSEELDCIDWRGEKFLVGTLLAYNTVYFTWSIEHYNRCSFRCAYCCMDSQGNSVPVPAPGELESLLDADFRKAMRTGHFTPGVTPVVLSCLTDPYVEIDQQAQLTRRVIEYLIRKQYPIAIVTRGVHICRDLDLLVPYRDRCEISFSLPIVDARALRRYEPHLPPLENRLAAIQACVSAGLATLVRINPWIPGVSQVDRTLKLLPEGVDVLVSPMAVASALLQGDTRHPMPGHGPRAGDGLLQQRFRGFAYYGFSQTATRLFHDWSQQEINLAYIRERNRIGFRRRVRWAFPPLDGFTMEQIAHRFLKPGELDL